jgi:hypothetical protein
VIIWPLRMKKPFRKAFGTSILLAGLSAKIFTRLSRFWVIFKKRL